MTSPSYAPPAAALRGVTKRHGTQLVLTALSLEVEPGQVLALLGPNGAGKSTTVALLTGRLRPDEGEVLLFERDPRSRLARLRLGAMPQTAGLPRYLSVAEQLDLFRGYYDDPRPLDEVMRLTGLADLADRRCAYLSGGQQRCVHFAMAIGGRPDMLILDEPTTGLDIEARRLLWDSIRAEARRGAAILLTTHYLEEAETLADRIVVLDRGRVIADGTPDAIKAGTSAAVVRCRTKLSLTELAGLPGVVSVSAEGAKVSLSSNAAPQTLRALLAADAGLTDISVAGASLEDAFINLISKPEDPPLLGGR